MNPIEELNQHYLNDMYGVKDMGKSLNACQERWIWLNKFQKEDARKKRIPSLLEEINDTVCSLLNCLESTERLYSNLELSDFTKKPYLDFEDRTAHNIISNTVISYYDTVHALWLLDDDLLTQDSALKNKRDSIFNLYHAFIEKVNPIVRSAHGNYSKYTKMPWNQQEEYLRTNFSR